MTSSTAWASRIGAFLLIAVALYVRDRLGLRSYPLDLLLVAGGAGALAWVWTKR